MEYKGKKYSNGHLKVTAAMRTVNIVHRKNCSGVEMSDPSLPRGAAKIALIQSTVFHHVEASRRIDDSN